ncbi:hypothetical protein ABZ319_38770 [Nocardia sp. NPDC005978]|uniref:hypothetical protein n=1 Tax=Nocardia sp. NPDC005978 TaxID=3156725 RepID=UPI0033B535A9
MAEKWMPGGPAGPRMTVEAAFLVTGRGVIVAGTIDSGEFRPGQTVRVSGPGGSFDSTVRAIDIFCRQGARKNNRIGLLLTGVRKEQFEAGQQIVGWID